MQEFVIDNEFKEKFPTRGEKAFRPLEDSMDCLEATPGRSMDSEVGVVGIGTPLPPNLIISIITGELYHSLIAAASESTTAKAKAALRDYIDTLEDIYRQL